MAYDYNQWGSDKGPEVSFNTRDYYRRKVSSYLTPEQQLKYKNRIDEFANTKGYESIHGKKSVFRGLSNQHTDMNYQKLIQSWENDDAKNNPPKPIVAESTVRAESTEQAQRQQSAQNTGVPAQEGSTDTDRSTETTKRTNRRKGKRGFIIRRDAGTGINI